MSDRSGTSGTITLYGDARSGNTGKVVFTLRYLDIRYDWIEVDSVGGKTRTPAFLAINPQGQIPAVILPDGRILAQSNAIVRYFAQGTSLLPNDPWPRFKIDEWMFWEANNHELAVSACIGDMTYRGKSREDRDEATVARAERALDYMDGQLAGREWLIGPSLSAADIALIAYTRAAERGGLELARRPALRSWIDRCEAELGLDSGSGMAGN